MSISPEPIFRAMRRELTEVGVQSVLFSVGLATFNSIIKDCLTGVVFKWILLGVAIFKICSMYNPPKQGRKTYDAAVHDYPAAQILVDIVFLALMKCVSDQISQIQTKLTTPDITTYGPVIATAVSFCASLNILILCRGTFLLLDWMGGGHLSRGTRKLVSSQVEGLPVGRSHIHGD